MIHIISMPMVNHICICVNHIYVYEYLIYVIWVIFLMLSDMRYIYEIYDI